MTAEEAKVTILAARETAENRMAGAIVLGNAPN
ncbi:hypothetical protein SAMN05421684_7946 [Asanoa ishikariensis]|uniref:Uncharacterized protein n=1 Tax=Asanoa ishikariensis TaxID=137265 RepID=A0A1H3US02_9ACTN|nr:hypothetical protein SAMN05421684_7946 [Asanoa ishikariensis]